MGALASRSSRGGGGRSHLKLYAEVIAYWLARFRERDHRGDLCESEIAEIRHRPSRPGCRVSTKDVKIFKLKARGDPGAGKTELLIAFGRIARSFGMATALSSDGHDMLITSTKAQRG